MAEIEIRRAADRAVTSTDWLHSAHSFAFGSHYDPANLSFGPLLAHNVDELQPGDGYPRHRHAGIEIVTWVLSGVLEHVDVTGNRQLPAGWLQVLSAGSGIEHTERSGSMLAPVRVAQMWLASAEPAARPAYAAAELPPAPGLVLAASGRRPAPVSIRQPAAELFIGRLAPGFDCSLPDAPLLHVFPVTGTVELAVSGSVGYRLAAEDAARVTDAAGLRVAVLEPAELLVWTLSVPA